MKNENLRISIWIVALFVLSAWMGFGWLRYPPGERIELAETPFDNTAGLDGKHWTFLNQAKEVLPEGETYTIRASDPDEEMSLFMLSGSVLGAHVGIPWTYYGVPNEHVGSVRWVLSYRCEVVSPGERVVVRLDDGCVCERSQ